MWVETFVRLAIGALWLLWLGYWIVAACDVKPTRWRERVATRTLHATPLVICAALLMAGGGAYR